MRAGRPWIAVAVFVGIGGVLSAGALAQQGQGNRYTQFRYPAWNPHNAECIWGEAHVFGPMQADNDIDPGNCVEATERAEAYVTVRGEQIEAYGWAKDNCALTPATVSAAKSLAANDTNFTITLITKPIWCASLMRVDMKPMFTARAEVDSPGNAAASGMMESNCPVINQAKARIDGSVSSTGGTQNSVWSMTVFGNGASISTSDSVGGGAVEKTFTTYTGDQKETTSATVNVLCSVDVSVTADSEGDWTDPAEVEAWVWDSKPGVDFHANCPTTCTGYVYWEYFWY